MIKSLLLAVALCATIASASVGIAPAPIMPRPQIKFNCTDGVPVSIDVFLPQPGTWHIDLLQPPCGPAE